MTTSKRKRFLLLTIVTIIIEVLLVSMSKDNVNKTATFLEDTHLLSTDIELMESFDTSIKEAYPAKDKLELLFDKFDFSYEYRDFFRQVCLLQNVDPIWAISLMQIESWCGHHAGYKTRSSDRMYYTFREKTWDEGLFQLTSYSKYRKEQEVRFYNPELLFNLGYIRDLKKFDALDDISNMQVGVAYLGFLYRYYGSYYKAVMAYNTGLGNVNKGKIPKVTYQYANAIKNNWKYREGDVENNL